MHKLSNLSNMSNDTTLTSRNMAQNHEYSPLPSGEHMRLARIDPGAFEDNLTIELMTVSFRTATVLGYNALSYVWGDERDPAILSVKKFKSTNDRACLEITQNLDIALRYLRRSDPYQLLWIDALCINQYDDMEKSSQVRRMGDIFRNASRVIAWLGPAGTQGERGMELLHELSSDFEPKFDIDFEWVLVVPTSDTYRSSEAQAVRNAYRPCLTSAGGLALLDIIERPWFRRLWIRQEICLVNLDAPMVRCGQKSMPWQKFRRVLASLLLLGVSVSDDGRRNTTQEARLARAMNSLGTLIFQRSVYLSGLRWSLQGSQCKDDRDRIFASLELLQQSERGMGIEPDYSKSVAEVYLDVARRYITYSRHAEMLQECSLPSPCIPSADQCSLFETPTWVPRWSSVDPVSFLSRVNLHASIDIEVPQLRPCVLNDAQMIKQSQLQIWGVPGPIVDAVGHPFLNDRTKTQIEKAEALRAALLGSVFTEELDAPRSNLNDTFLKHYVDILTFGNMEFTQANAARMKLTPENGSTALREVLSRQDHRDWTGMNQDTSELVHHFCSVAGQNLSGSRLAVSFDGELLMVPEHAQHGDQVCALLGCSSPVLLRPSPSSAQEGQFLVVGACYSTAMAAGDAFLGKMPANIRRAFSDQTHDYLWIDVNTRKTVSEFDPRLEPLVQRLPPDVAKPIMEALRKGSKMVQVDIDILEEHRASIGAVGGKIRRFDLI